MHMKVMKEQFALDGDKLTHTRPAFPFDDRAPVAPALRSAGPSDREQPCLSFATPAGFLGRNYVFDSTLIKTRLSLQ